MNRNTKLVKIRFFQIDADDDYFANFPTIYTSNLKNEKSVRIVKFKGIKYLIKIYRDKLHQQDGYFLTVIKERNTWQVKAFATGEISGVGENQGIIGDPFYYVIFPESKVALGFTTGISISTKSVLNTVLQQFKKSRLSNVCAVPITKEREFGKLSQLSALHNVKFKTDTKTLKETIQEAPEILKEISTGSLLDISTKIELQIENIESDVISKDKLIDLVNFLSEDDSCSTLTVKGVDLDGKNVSLDFHLAYIVYPFTLETRELHVDEQVAEDILLEAINSIEITNLLND